MLRMTIEAIKLIFSEFSILNAGSRVKTIFNLNSNRLDKIL